VTRYGDGTAWVALAPGDVFHVPGGVPHALRTPAENAAIGLRV